MDVSELGVGFDESHMDTSGHLRWFQAALCVGVAYLLVGLASAALANTTTSSQIRVGWRLAAWLTSAGVFAAHVAYERLRLRSSYGSASFHTALAAGFGAFLLAVAATVHANMSARLDHRFALALVLWPVITAVPAFLVALVLSVVLRPRAVAGQGDREAFDRVLAKVPSVPPDPWDRWDEETPSKKRPVDAE